MKNVSAVILAAGDGTRMKSSKPKVLCEVLFHPMILWVTDACAGAGIENCCAVLGEGQEQVKAVLPGSFTTVIQQERKGTGHAVMMAGDYIKNGGFEDVAVLCGDVPFVTAQDLKNAYRQHKAENNAVTVFAAKVKNPTGYGRIVRSAVGVSAIVEQADADMDILKIDEINAGIYWFNARFLLQSLGRMSASNAQGEYYLTDTVADAVKSRLRVSAYAAHHDAALGANDRRTLSLLGEIARKKVIGRLLDDGVDIPFPDQVVVGHKVEVGSDTKILPGSILKGKTVIGKGCEIGPNTQIADCVIGDNCKIISSFAADSQMEDGVTVGPMAHIRPGCRFGRKVKIGNFVEVKNSNIGAETSIAHLSYVGDSDVGECCNLGCGIVTVNFDGSQKARTTIGDGVFVGCNTNLIAPVTLGDMAYCAAATTITEDVPAEALVIGRCRQTIKENWNTGGVKFKKASKDSGGANSK